MKEKRSIYECPVCGERVSWKAGERVICSDDKVVMVEANKGIITKGSTAERFKGNRSTLGRLRAN